MSMLYFENRLVFFLLKAVYSVVIHSVIHMPFYIRVT